MRLELSPSHEFASTCKVYKAPEYIHCAILYNSQQILCNEYCSIFDEYFDVHNFTIQRCQSKCGSVGGMQYHYERCTGNAPRFKCDQCGRTYESRTGLNYHMASSHLNEHSEDNKVCMYVCLSG